MGWLTDEQVPRVLKAGTAYKDLTSANDVITLTAQWQAQTSTFTYIAQTGGTVSTPESTNNQPSLTLTFDRVSPTITTVIARPKPGYAFLEWRDTVTGDPIVAGVTASPSP